MLKFLERLHWIDIESERELQFQIRLSDVKNKEEIQFLKRILSKKSEISQRDGNYYLKNISKTN